MYTLLENKANASQSDYTGRTALHLAVFKGNEEIADLLIKHGANINQKDNNGKSPLLKAIEKGKYEQMFACKRFDCEKLFSILLGNVGMAELLIENGADVDFKDNGGITLMQKAVASGNTLIK